MRHIHSLEEANLTGPSVVTIGSFDGVHRGHQYLIRQLIDNARQTGRTPVVLTFYPHPRMVLRGFEPGYYLTAPDERAAYLAELGVELIITHPFDDAVRQMRAADFVSRLATHLNMTGLWVGENFSLGYQREGNVAFLKDRAADFGYELRVVHLVDANGERVSSTRIREALAAGDVTEAQRLLGRPYRLPGTVVEGAKRGRTIGFPTANLDISEERAVPARGVYAAQAHTPDGTYPAMVNIGLRPTFGDTVVTSVEAFLMDYSGDLYGETLTLDFVARIRNEMKFSGVEALIAQIQQDVARGREILSVVDRSGD
ncbi:MAG: bifunctional riboflavin kinase/FAD synthetase [Chloroflexi bacterium]|nr:bifunctional riboflavin kinase/FAD synthetase [Chloroflexota bacterium]